MIHNMEIMAKVKTTPFVLSPSINPLQAVMFPRGSSGDVQAVLRKYRSLSFHPNLDRPVYPNFVIITTRDASAIAKVGPENKG